MSLSVGLRPSCGSIEEGLDTIYYIPTMLLFASSPCGLTGLSWPEITDRSPISMSCVVKTSCGTYCLDVRVQIQINAASAVSTMPPTKNAIFYSYSSVMTMDSSGSGCYAGAFAVEAGAVGVFAVGATAFSS